MKLFSLALLALCVVFSFAGCSGSSTEGGEAAQANQEIVKQNPSNVAPVPQEQASGDAVAMPGPKKGGG